VTIKGLVFGTNDAISNTDHYGIVARRITSVKIGGAAISLNSTDSTDIIDIGPNGDMTILEV
jgi:hypothetical protein